MKRKKQQIAMEDHEITSITKRKKLDDDDDDDHDPTVAVDSGSQGGHESSSLSSRDANDNSLLESTLIELVTKRGSEKTC